MFTLYVKSADQLLITDDEPREEVLPNKVLSLQDRIEREYIKRDRVALESNKRELEKKKL